VRLNLAYLAGAPTRQFFHRHRVRLSFIDWSSTMLPFLPLHALAVQRGDGLHPELLALFERHAGSETGLATIIEPDETEPLNHARDSCPKSLEVVQR
jgi:hypothetical protein